MTRPQVGVFALGMLLNGQLASAIDLFVDDDAPVGGNGFSWNTAFRNVSDALLVAAASDGGADVIRVAQGVYKRDPAVRTLSFTLPSDPTPTGSGEIDILGGFAGIGAPDPDAQNIQLYVTILSGDLAGDDSPTDPFNVALIDDNTHHILRASGSAITPQNTLVEGFTIKSGNAWDDPQDETGGGGMRNDSGARPLVSKCIFTLNHAKAGAGMHNLYTTAEPDSETGGASPEVRDCQFILNSSVRLNSQGAPMAGSGNGGGMKNQNGSTARIVNCRFEKNLGLGGGGMRNQHYSNVTVVGCTFISNVAVGISNGGGLMNHTNTIATIVNCQFLGNRCGHVGGGVELRDCTTDITTTLTNCTFVGNSAALYGGGMRAARDTRCELTNCTFVANVARPPSDSPAGGGFSIGGDSCEPPFEARVAEMYNCVFWGNTVDRPEPVGGTQISTIGNAPGILHIHDSNVQDSDPGENGVYVAPEIICGPGVVSWEGLRLDEYPIFLAAPGDGGDGFGDDPLTTSVDESANDNYGDLRLNYGLQPCLGAGSPNCVSPCINKGVSDHLPQDAADVDNDGNTAETIPLDLGYLARQACAVDMGAYEQHEYHACPGDANSDGQINVQDLLLVISLWGQPGEGDVEPFPCGDGTTNVQDLLFVISNWGPGCPQTAGGGQAPRTVGECHNNCIAVDPTGGVEYSRCMEGCIESLCIQQLIDCD